MRIIPLIMFASLTLTAQITLEPARIVHLETAMPEQYRSGRIAFAEMETSGDDLYFRVAAGEHGAVQGILKTDDAGNFKSWFILQERSDANFVPDPAGNVYVLAGRVINIYGPDGKLTLIRQVPAPISRIVWSNGTLVGVNFTTLLTGLESGHPKEVAFAPFNASNHLDAFPAADGRIMAADSVQAEIRLINQISGDTILIRPSHPRILTRIEGNGGLMALSPMTTSPDGRIFTSTGSYRFDLAPLLEFDSSGAVKNEYALVLPRVLPDPDHKGYLRFGDIAVTSHHIFVLDNRAFLAVYNP